MDDQTKTTLLALVVGFLMGSVLFGAIGYAVFREVIYIEDPLTFEEEIALAFFDYSEFVDIDDENTEVFEWYYNGTYYLVFVERFKFLNRDSRLRWRYATLD